MKERKVLVIYGSADLYGASKNLIRSLEGFRRLGWKSITVLPHDGPLVEIMKNMGFEVVLMEHGVLRRQNLNPIGLLTLFGQVFSSFFKLSVLIKQEKITLIYTNSNANIIGGLLKLRHGIPHIWHIHEIIERPKWFKSLLETYIKLTEDRVICVSEAVIKNFSRIKAEKLKLLYNGIDTQPYAKADYDLKSEIGIPENKLLIGMVARVNLWKGQFYFLEIAALLKKKYPNLHFVMAGDAFPGYEYLYDEVSSLTQKLGLEDCVTNLGFRLDVPEILSGLDIFVVPSILPDPLPTTVLEGMAAAKPVIATRHGGATEMVIDGETGFLIPWDNPQEAVVAFEKLIESAELREKMGKAGRQRVNEYFNQEKYLENFGKLVSEV
ncbi:glycosyltransferase [Algoriphagus sp. CAU 1675]|uniref:glycosyltransferase n=1 Tax=Algoriphagus sp. CAU 1675 TaxID=3032597 RepID=UPI0023DC81F9|nr:glycosyltransferase [Algoriphagus sp. CAU 1675]MDF2156435.1 glycosyltransferase [Algoriphagus sp. CAU 1675]